MCQHAHAWLDSRIPEDVPEIIRRLRNLCAAENAEATYGHWMRSAHNSVLNRDGWIQGSTCTKRCPEANTEYSRDLSWHDPST